MKRSFLSFCLGCFLCVSAMAQEKSSFSVRAGYLHATTAVRLPLTSPFGMPSIDGRSGFYAGGAFTHQHSRLVISQLELTFQQKGQTIRSQTGETALTPAYRYLGLTPLIGISPVRQVRLFVGPELNVLVNKKTPWQDSQRIEAGVAGRLVWQPGRFGFNAGYFRGLSRYDGASVFASRADFRNRNWQFGMIFTIQ